MLKRLFRFLIVANCLFDAPASFAQMNRQGDPVGNPAGWGLDELLAKAEQVLDRHPDSSVFFGMRALELASVQEYQEAAYKSASLIADAWYYQNELSNAIDYYRLAADYALEIYGGQSDSYASRVSDIGYCYYTLEIFDLAAEYFNSALEIFMASDNQSGISDQLNNLGLVYFAWGNYNLAVEFFSRTLAIDLESKDSLSLSISYNNMGKVYETWGYYDTAIEHYLESLRLLRDQGDEARKSIRLSNIGTCYVKKKDYVLALDYLNRALSIDKKYDNPEKIAVRYNEIANVFSAKGEFEKALNYNLTALRILDSLDKKESTAIVLRDLGANYLSLKRIPRAKTYFEQSIAAAREVGSLSNEMAAYDQLARLYEQAGEFENALMYHRKFDVLKDSIFTISSHGQLADYRIKYETAQKEQENDVLRNEIIKKKRAQRNLLISGAFVLSALVLLFFLLREKSRTLRKDRKLYEQERRLAELVIEKAEIEKQRLHDRVFAEKQVNRLQKEKFEAEIKIKNKELVGSTLQLVNKNEVLTAIKNKVKGYNSHIPEAVYRDLMNYVNTNADLDQNWKSFRLEFEKLNPGFFDRLRRAYPDFSEQHQRLSAFLLVDLTSKEIAQLMNVSVAAVNKNRQRLRKKLSLEPEADLANYLRSL